MKRFTLVVTVLSIALLARSAASDEPKKSAKGKDGGSAAIRESIASYVAAYNRGDAKEVASHWSETGEWVSPSGQRFKGREAIQRELEALLKEKGAVRIEVPEPAVRMLTDEVAVEEGTVRVHTPGEAPSDSTYIAIHVKKDGKWQLDSVRETSVPEAPVLETPLSQLEWLVGQWVDQSDESTIETSVSWSKNHSFLTASFKVSISGLDDLEGTQIIGWDPAAGTIRSWMFDSDGGFGEGTWSIIGRQWSVKFSHVLPDGRRGSSTNIYTFLDENTYTWESIGRQVDGEFLPNVEPVKVTRRTTTGADQPEPSTSKPTKD